MSHITRLSSLSAAALASLCLSLLACTGSQASTLGTPLAWGDWLYGQTNVPRRLTNVTAIAAGGNFNLAVLADGTVAGWGESFLGQTTPPPDLEGVVSVATGFNHSVALRADGTVAAWGDNSGGQTDVPPGLANVRALAGGHYHTLALRGDGRVIAWGANGFGESTVPPGLSGVVAVAAGNGHSLALTTAGHVVGWGANSYGQANGRIQGDVAAIAAGDGYSLALLRNGVVLAWGNPNLPVVAQVPRRADVVSLAAGSSHALALTTSRQVIAWGDNTSGQATPPTGLAGVVALSAGQSHSLALQVVPPVITQQPQSQTVVQGTNVTFIVRASGSLPLLYQWQFNDSPLANATNATYTIANVQASDAGTYTVVVSNGGGSATSSNATLILNFPPSITTQPQSAATNLGARVVFSVAASGSPTLRYQWRLNGTNIANAIFATYEIATAQPIHAGNYTVVVTNGFGSVTSAVATLTLFPLPTILVGPQSQTAVVGGIVSFSVVASNATRYQWRKNDTAIAGATNSTYTLPNVKASDAGAYTVVVMNPYGGVLSSTAQLTVLGAPPVSRTVVVVWGQEPYWNGSNYVSTQPPPGLSNVMALAAGEGHSLALQSNGVLVGWGDNSHNQAVPPNPSLRAAAIAAGAFHSLALASNGTVVAWGRNDSGQSSVPGTATDIVGIAAGRAHSLALRRNGTIVGWGSSVFGQTIPPPGTSNLIAIAAGGDFSLGLRSNSTVIGWGKNDFGQARPPSGLSNVVAIAAGEEHSLALLRDGRLVAWGANGFGQTNVPAGLAKVMAIACGRNHCLALLSNGVVVAWGQNNEGQIEVPSDLSRAARVAAGGARSLALRVKLLKLSAPARQTGGGYLLRMRFDDGSAVGEELAESVTLRAADSLSLPPLQWPALNFPVTWQEGELRVVDRTLPPAPRRFYMVVEE